MNPVSERSYSLSIFAWAALGALAGTWFMVSITWDGGYLIFSALQEQREVVPHHRWITGLFQRPGLFVAGFFDNPAWAARLYGAMNYLMVLAGLAVCLLVLRGRLVAMRKWGIGLALIVSLPGILCPCSEVMPALAVFSALMAFLWAGPQWKTMPFAAATAFVLWGTHPLAMILYGVAAVCLGWMWKTKVTPQRHLTACVALLLLACAVTKFITIYTLGTEYERSQFSLGQLMLEFLGALVASPWGVVPVAFWLLVKIGKGEYLTADKLRRGLFWLFFIGIAFSSYPLFWSGELAYRKFAPFFAGVFALAGTRELILSQTRPHDFQASRRHTESILTLRFAQVFCCALLAGSLSWAWLCSRFVKTLQANPAVWVDSSALPWLLHTPLDHWSATPTALLLQNSREPQRGYLCPGAIVRSGQVEMFPVELLDLEDRWFKLSHLRAALPPTPQVVSAQ